MTSGSTTWVKRYVPKPAAGARLFCFPHAGVGAATFLRWSQQLPDPIEVCSIELPGRQSRRDEEPFTRMDPLVEALGGAIEPLLDKPFALFGNSMGALVAFELSRLLRRRGRSLPEHLFLCARPAPDAPAAHEPVHQLPESEFIEKIRAYYGGIPQVILDEPTLLAMTLPTLRADLEVVETYEHRPEAPLDCDFSVFAGTEDRSIQEESLAAWSNHTTGECDVTFLQGNHLILETQAERLQRWVVALMGS